MKNKALNKTFLKNIDEIAHLNSLSKKLIRFNSQYKDFEKFINDFESFLLNNIEIPSLDLSTQDKIFEGIIHRLDALSDYKNITIKIARKSRL